MTVYRSYISLCLNILDGRPMYMLRVIGLINLVCKYELCSVDVMAEFFVSRRLVKPEVVM